MNSLLQTLFMTKELRRRLYRWQFQEHLQTSKEDSIPYQLQVLFGRLQLTSQSSVDTKGLIHSFGWDSMETFIQNDVQEFCRVLFDAIERSVGRSEEKSMVSEMFQGELIDYVCCQSCHTESHRQDQFLDISLAIRTSPTQPSHSTLTQALEAFIRPEVLSGPNQYFCSHCNRKTDAIKGLRFKTFPKVVMIQLKRFELDMERMVRRKVEDYVEFPMEMDLGKYEMGRRVEREGRKEVREDRPMAYILNPVSGPLPASRDSSPLPHPFHPSLSPSLPRSPSLYSLYSVLVHSGSISGGHYYAYIKSFEDHNWYRFNDSQVTKATVAEVKGTYGGKDGTAYLLVYQREGEETGDIQDQEVPEEVRKEVEEEKVRAKIDRETAYAKTQVTPLRLFHKGHEKVVEVSRSLSISSLIPVFQTQFHLSSPLRIRKYSPFHGTIGEVLGESNTLEESGLNTGNAAVIGEEMKEDGQFEEFKYGDFELKVVPWREKMCESGLLTYAEKIAAPVKVLVNQRSLWQDVREEIRRKLYPETQEVLIQRRTYIGEGVEVLSPPPSSTVSDLRLSDSSILLVEPFTLSSLWLHEIHLDLYRAEIHFNPFTYSHVLSLKDLQLRVLIDLRATIHDLKVAISDVIGEDISRFIVKKGLNRSGPELIDMKQTLVSAGFGPISGVYLERGLPLQVNDVRLVVSLISPASRRLGPTALVTLWDLCTVTVHCATLISEAKQTLFDTISGLYPSMNLPFDRLVMREIGLSRPGKVVEEGRVGKEGEMGERQVGLQVCEGWGEGRMLVTVKEWREEGLGTGRFVGVCRDWTMQELGVHLSAVSHIPLSRLLLQSVSSLTLFQLSDLLTEPWVSPLSRPESISVPPLSLYPDSLLLIRDSQTPLKPHFSSLPIPEKPLIIRLKGES